MTAWKKWNSTLYHSQPCTMNTSARIDIKKPVWLYIVPPLLKWVGTNKKTYLLKKHIFKSFFYSIIYIQRAFQWYNSCLYPKNWRKITENVIRNAWMFTKFWTSITPCKKGNSKIFLIPFFTLYGLFNDTSFNSYDEYIDSRKLTEQIIPFEYIVCSQSAYIGVGAIIIRRAFSSKHILKGILIRWITRLLSVILSWYKNFIAKLIYKLSKENV